MLERGTQADELELTDGVAEFESRQKAVLVEKVEYVDVSRRTSEYDTLNVRLIPSTVK